MNILTEGLDADTFTTLSVLINHMGTCHPLHAQQKDSPFITTVKVFQKLPADRLDELFLAYCLQLVQKLKAIDRAIDSIPPTIDYDRLTCVLNLISDLTFVPTVKAVLTPEYIQNLQTVLGLHYPFRKCEHMAEHKNRELAKEICSELYMKR